MLNIKIFSFIWSSNGEYFKSSGDQFEITDSDFCFELTEPNKQKLADFIETAKVGESLFLESVLILREGDDFEADWDVMPIPADRFSPELKAKMTSPKRVEKV